MSIFRSFAGVEALLFCLCVRAASATLRRHDASFSPDHVLHATTGNVTIDCESRYSVLLNGSTPGPVIYLEEGKTSWIRVYNQIPNDNLTVVSNAKYGMIGKIANLSALAWSDCKSRAVL